MSESESDLEVILDLLVSAGYSQTGISSKSDSEKLIGGLAWAIAAINPQYKEDQIKVGESVQAAVQSIGCPYTLQAQQIQGLDYNGTYPVVKWIVNQVQLVRLRAEMGDEELAAKLRESLLQRRQIGDVPSQVELIQYELRFSELNVQIQEKLRQTHKYYGTYNVLLEIKELMLKETSLLNSLSSQFQNAMMTTVGRCKLIESMEGILKGTQQAEQKLCDTLKQKHAAAVVEQRHCSSLLKAFQEEYARSKRLWSATAM